LCKIHSDEKRAKTKKKNKNEIKWTKKDIEKRNWRRKLAKKSGRRIDDGRKYEPTKMQQKCGINSGELIFKFM
jgi:hypothetical protein